MTDRHREPKVPARLPPQELEAGRDQLQKHGRSVQEFVVACFRALRANPGPLLALLGDYWPAAKKPGRPPKKRDTEETP